MPARTPDGVRDEASSGAADAGCGVPCNRGYQEIMLMYHRLKFTVLGLNVLLMLLAGCHKKTTPVPPPPPAPVPAAAPAPQPPPPAPAIGQFTAEPTSLVRGQSSTLQWQVTGEVTSVTINRGIGTVSNADRRVVSPGDSTTYTLTATGPGGSTVASVSVNVSSPPPPPPEPAPPVQSKETVASVLSTIQDAYYDYDSSEIRPDADAVLMHDSEVLKSLLTEFPTATLVIEGHCDERGSAEYNLGLGDHRAEAAKEFLVKQGVPAARLQTTSYGKGRPQCDEHSEECWQKNRRVHFSPASGN